MCLKSLNVAANKLVALPHVDALSTSLQYLKLHFNPTLHALPASLQALTQLTQLTIGNFCIQCARSLSLPHRSL